MSQLPDWLQRVPLRGWQIVFWLVWLCATILMLLPAEELPSVDLSDKTEHLLAFFGLMALAWLGYRQQQAPWQLAAWLIAYGIGIECIQYFIPSRSFSVLDMVADAAGVLPAWLLATQLEKS